MEILSDEAGSLVSSRGKKEMRNCVCFERFNDFKNGHLDELAEDLLQDTNRVFGICQFEWNQTT